MRFIWYGEKKETIALLQTVLIHLTSAIPVSAPPGRDIITIHKQKSATLIEVDQFDDLYKSS